MRFGILAPLFAAGLAAVIFPLIVHLVHKEKRDPVAFPSLMFIRRMPYPFSSRQKIRDWLLFALRCGLVALAAFAFARPVFAPRGAQASTSTSGQETVVLLDRSFSMKYGDRWSKARDEVGKLIDAVGAGDRLTIVPFDISALAVNEATGDRNQLRSALDSIVTTDLGTRLTPAVAVAQRIFGASSSPRKRLAVISDFQRSGWDLHDDSRLAAGTEVLPMDVGGEEVLDRAVRSVEIRRDPGGASDRVTVSVRVANLGPAARNVGVTLEVNGRLVAQTAVDLPNDGGATAVFRSIAAPPQPQQAVIKLQRDSLPGDDEHHFMLTRAPSIPVLLVDHRDSPEERRLFLSRALAIGDRPAFDVLQRSSSVAGAADLIGKRLVILADAGVPAGIPPARLIEFVRGGGGLINILGERTSARVWPDQAAALVPGEIAAPSDRVAEQGAVLGFVNYSHPALAVFSGVRSGDLSAARFFRYRAIDTTDGILARFDDGSVALSEHFIGRGRVITVASGLDGVWNDLPRQAVFLPFIHQLAKHAATWREDRRAWPAGDAVNLRDVAADGAGAATVDRWTVLSPSGKRLGVGGDGDPRTLELREVGVYQIRPSGQPTARPVQLAVNVPPSELDFGTYDTARLTNALLPDPALAVADSTAVGEEAMTLTEVEAKQSLWWYLLLAAAALLFFEALLARRLSMRRPAQT
ncbi:MAG: BatA domain-containing protein [Gemmatimonadota bacterium]